MFGISDYGAFVAAMIVFLLIPGPGNLALITSTSKGGVSGGMGATLGVIAGDQVLMWMAVAGVAALLATYPTAFAAVQWLGAIYLAWLGFKMLVAKPGGAPVLHIKPLTFGLMAATIAVLAFLYGLVVVLLTHFLAERLRASPVIGRILEKIAGVFLIGFGVKLALSK